MKKLMLICSLACAFVLSSFALSAQNYVSSSEAVSILEAQVEELKKSTTTDQGTAAKVVYQAPETRIEVAYMKGVVRLIQEEDKTVEQSLAQADTVLFDKYGYKGTLAKDISDRVEGLLLAN